MFVFVGNQEKWDSLIEDTGHQALEDRYRAKKLVLSELTTEDYKRLVRNVAELVRIAHGLSGSLSDREVVDIVDEAASQRGGISNLSPRRLLLTPNGSGNPDTLVDIIESRLL